jgi:hypothetical protein
MMLTKEQSSNLFHARNVSREGCKTENAASVAIANCLNDGVHSPRV